MRTALLTMAAAAIVAGCLADSPRRGDPASFDLGPAATIGSSALGLTAVEVAAPSWLGGQAMQYRLLYADPARRQEYADSRWAAPPAELLRDALERRLAGEGGGHCRLRVELHEFVQVFDSPQASHLVLEGRATLVSNPGVVGRRAFSLAPAAATADARGGVGAAAAAVRALGAELEQWLKQASAGGACGNR